MGIRDAIRGLFGGGAPEAVRASTLKADARPDERDGMEVKEKEGRFKAVEVTVPSIEHLERNEDASTIDADQGSMALGDGAGGHAGGDRISRFVVGEIQKEMPRFVIDDQGRAITDPEKVSQRMDLVIHEVAERAAVEAERIFADVTREYDDLQGKMDAASTARKQQLQKIIGRARKPQTTLITAQIVQHNQRNFAVIKSVGDSGAFVVRASGQVEQIRLNSQDILSRQVKHGMIAREQADWIEDASSIDDLISACRRVGWINNEQVRTLASFKSESGLIAPSRVQTELRGVSEQVAKVFELFDRYWGTEQLRADPGEMLGKKREEWQEELETDTAIVQLFPGDILGLESDGPKDNLTPTERQAALGGDSVPVDRARRYVRAAVERSKVGWTKHLRSKADDMTVTMMEVSKEFKSPVAVPREVRLPPPERSPASAPPRVPTREGMFASTQEITQQDITGWKDAVLALQTAEHAVTTIQDRLVSHLTADQRALMERKQVEFQGRLAQARSAYVEARIGLARAKSLGKEPIRFHPETGDMLRAPMGGSEPVVVMVVDRQQTDRDYLYSLKHPTAGIYRQVTEPALRALFAKEAERLEAEREAVVVEAARQQAQAAAEPTARQGLRTKWEPSQK